VVLQTRSAGRWTLDRVDRQELEWDLSRLQAQTELLVERREE
jgi:hypothetical protein